MKAWSITSRTCCPTLRDWGSEIRRVLRSERGSAATEAILVLSLLVPMFAVMITLGDLWADQVALDHAAAMAVRRAAADGGDSPQLRSDLQANLAAVGLSAGTVAVRVQPPAPAWQEQITVHLRMPRRIRIPLLGHWDLQLSSQFSARNEVGEVAD